MSLRFCDQVPFAASSSNSKTQSASIWKESMLGVSPVASWNTSMRFVISASVSCSSPLMISFIASSSSLESTAVSPKLSKVGFTFFKSPLVMPATLCSYKRKMSQEIERIKI
eukprot:Gregarina_sp_Poly_1__525@NODE_1126_length_5010_cov_45_168521_g690_i2_p7_GENE_NODE_1126_length_5010_cov_45_168521_g690_i2NODE_1126_length_5010_cov_45_168521_g690_i2_p7_ORF_typecomplete_len112_score11_52_NODE_1126_length_5010_cov_45_168521_g690_i240614396